MIASKSEIDKRLRGRKQSRHVEGGGGRRGPQGVGKVSGRGVKIKKDLSAEEVGEEAVES